MTSDSTDLCISVIAIAGTPDYRYLQENNIDFDVYDDGEEFECELPTGLTVPLKGMDYQMAQMQSMLNDGSFISGEMTVGVSDDMEMLLAMMLCTSLRAMLYWPHVVVVEADLIMLVVMTLAIVGGK